MRPIALLLVLLAATSARAVRAENETRSPASPLDQVLLRLGSPADPEAVGELLALEHLLADPSAAQRALDALAGGGWAAVEGLVQLARHRDPGVREAALRALGSAGLRSDAALSAVRTALTDVKPAVRLAACAAVGPLGDAQDVPRLLDLLAGSDEACQAAAHHALRTLTGLNMPALPHRWEYWWAQAADELPTLVERALLRLDAGTPKAGLEEARLLLRRSGWAKSRAVQETARSWIGSTVPRLRREGYLLAASARCADLAVPLLRALRYEADPSARSAGLAAAATLGCRVDAAALPVAQPVPLSR